MEYPPTNKTLESEQSSPIPTGTGPVGGGVGRGPPYKATMSLSTYRASTMTTVKACPLILVIALLLFSCEQREPSAPLKPTETSNSSPTTITVAEPKDNPSRKHVDEPPIASPSVTTEQSADSRPNAVPDWIEPDEREQLYLDYTVTDQHGNEMVQVNRADDLAISEIKKIGVE